MENEPAHDRINRRTSIDDLPELLSVPEFQAFAGVGRTAAYEFARVHGIRIGGKLMRIPRRAIVSAELEHA